VASVKSTTIEMTGIDPTMTQQDDVFARAATRAARQSMVRAIAPCSAQGLGESSAPRSLRIVLTHSGSALGTPPI
jgi:hypothetical protein